MKLYMKDVCDIVNKIINLLWNIFQRLDLSWAFPFCDHLLYVYMEIIGMVHILVYVISYMYVHFFLGDLLNVSFLFMKIIILYMNISMWSTFLDKMYTTYRNWYVPLPIDIKCKERVQTCKS